MSGIRTVAYFPSIKSNISAMQWQGSSGAAWAVAGGLGSEGSGRARPPCLLPPVGFFAQTDRVRTEDVKVFSRLQTVRARSSRATNSACSGEFKPC